jgi:hypothetical protein
MAKDQGFAGFPSVFKEPMAKRGMTQTPKKPRAWPFRQLLLFFKCRHPFPP